MNNLAEIFRNAIQAHPLMQHVLDAGALGPMPTNMMPAPPRPGPYEGDGYQRYNSPERKSSGFYGEVGQGKHPVTEFSLGGDGGVIQHPSIFQGMTGKQLQSVLDEANGGRRFPQSIANQAMNAAQDRVAQGLSPFWNEAQDMRFSR
jgi:hypothetical protein